MRPSRILLFYIVFISLLAGLYLLMPGWRGLPGHQTVDSLKHRYYLWQHPLANEDTLLFTPAPDTVLTFPETEKADSSLTPEPLIDLDSIYELQGRIRVLYYGDSQLEGDRITAGIRRTLMQEYGGSGPGLIQPLMPVMYTRSAEVRSSDNWKRYTYLSYMNGETDNKKFGPLGSYTRFEGKNSPDDEQITASVTISPSVFSDSLAAVYDRVSLIYGNCHDTVFVVIGGSDTTYFTGYLPVSSGITSLVVNTPGARDVSITVKGKVSPDFYGISISDSVGVIVDNVPLRGSAGFDFTMIQKESLAQGLRIIDPDIIILHFGLNVVKNIRSEYSFYTRGIYRQISLLKEICPDAIIVVAGVTDMAERSGEESSYDNIPAIIAAQREAADSAGVVFWDSWKAMGGANSIIRWAESLPPLAQPDLTHFTYAGSDTIAALMMNDLFGAAKGERAELKDTVIHLRVTTPADSVLVPVTAEKISNERPFIKEIFGYDSSKPFIFTSFGFWAFFLALLIGFTVFYRRRSLRSFYLLIFSLYFYYKAGGLFFGLLVLSTLIDYSAGRMMGASEKRGFRRLWLIVSLVANLGMLAYFKYTAFITGLIVDITGRNIETANWLAQWSNQLFGSGFDPSVIILPVGISFFTFQTISYSIDVYRRKIEPVRNIFDFGFYVSFFPQLVAGPIVRASEFIPQIYQEYHLHKREFGQALFLILNGLIKKMVISDYISVNFVDRIFLDPSLYTGFENLMASYGYGLQIYCDFSGYTDIALGVALLLGFRLPVNFNSPYKASSLSDFWKRWHISLSRWLRDYLYIPLGGNRRGGLFTSLNLMITMVLGGLWHGASMRFVIWGALHGAGLIIGKVTGKLSFLKSRAGRFISIFITFHFVTFCWIFFRGDSLHNIGLMLNRIFTGFDFSTVPKVVSGYWPVLSVIGIGYLIHFLPFKIKEAYRGLFIQQPELVKILIAVGVVVAITLIGSSDSQPFIYFRF